MYVEEVQGEKREWNHLLKYLLFAYRSPPHGFFPFEIIFGKTVRGPLEVLRDTWDSGKLKTQTVVDWVKH